MSIVRRSFATFFGVLLLQLTLLGSGTLCALQHAVSPSDAGAHVMRGMGGTSAVTTGNMASANPAISDSGSGPMSSDDCAGLGKHDGCGLPWAPGQCASMTTCDITVAPAANAKVSDAGRLVALAAPTASIAPSGPTFAPELPPPRA